LNNSDTGGTLDHSLLRIASSSSGVSVGGVYADISAPLNACEKLVKKFVEKLITAAKKDDLAAKRYVFSKIGCNQESRDLFDLVKAQFAETNGGYTSIIKYRFRKGDGAHMVILKLNV
jgi:ribosomal protein L17